MGRVTRLTATSSLPDVVTYSAAAPATIGLADSRMAASGPQQGADQHRDHGQPVRSLLPGSLEDALEELAQPHDLWVSQHLTDDRHGRVQVAASRRRRRSPRAVSRTRTRRRSLGSARRSSRLAATSWSTVLVRVGGASMAWSARSPMAWLAPSDSSCRTRHWVRDEPRWLQDRAEALVKPVGDLAQQPAPRGVDQPASAGLPAGDRQGQPGAGRFGSDHRRLPHAAPPPVQVQEYQPSVAVIGEPHRQAARPRASYPPDAAP
jgi:hypothetical protein